MTPSQMDLFDRATELLDTYDELAETEGLSSIDTRVQRFLEDVIAELEGA